jgi:hypothetical protein
MARGLACNGALIMLNLKLGMMTTAGDSLLAEFCIRSKSNIPCPCPCPCQKEKTGEELCEELKIVLKDNHSLDDLCKQVYLRLGDIPQEHGICKAFWLKDHFKTRRKHHI